MEMNLFFKILLYLATSFCISTGQSFLSLYARGIESPFIFTKWLQYSISSTFLYVSAVAYGIGLVMFIILLRFFPVAQVTITIMVSLVIMILIYSRVLGQELNSLQIIGAFIAMIGLCALNYKT